MAESTSFSTLRAACHDLPGGRPAASAAVARREATLTKPPKSLGRLEELVAWLAHWQGHAPPRLDSAEAGHRMLLGEIGLKPLVDLDMRLGEASGAAVALQILRSALACHTGMATFAQAGVSDKPAGGAEPKAAG
jgi:NaMN:DMB phosphoribosyltransferase